MCEHCGYDPETSKNLISILIYENEDGMGLHTDAHPELMKLINEKSVPDVERFTTHLREKADLLMQLADQIMLGRIARAIKAGEARVEIMRKEEFDAMQPPSRSNPHEN